jgi:hypothetical protein
MVNHLLETSHPLSSSALRPRVSVADCLPFSVHSSKFRILQPLYLPLLRKHRGCMGILPTLELVPLRCTSLFPLCETRSAPHQRAVRN